MIFLLTKKIGEKIFLTSKSTLKNFNFQKKGKLRD